MNETEQKPNLKKGILCILFSAFCFALMGMFVHLADFYGGQISAIQKSFFRNLIAFFLAALFFVRPKNTKMKIPKEAWMPLFLRAFFGTCGIFGYYYALSRIPIGNAAMLNKLSPFFAILFSWLLVQERMTFRQIIAVVGAFIGSLFIVKPSLEITAFLPELAGFASGVCAGAAYAFVRKLGLMRIDARVIILFFSGFSCLAAVPSFLWRYDTMTLPQVWILLGAGVAAAGGQFGITAAYRAAPPKEIAVFDYSNILFAAAFGYFIFDQKLDLWSWFGFALILIMALFIRPSSRPHKNRL